jgi:hypothetical protein
MPGKQIALPDGSYFACLNLKELQDKGYKGAKIFTDGYLEGYMISFTVTNGKPDKELIYFVQKK